MTIDTETPLGRVDAAFLDDGSLLIVWLRRVADRGELRAVAIAPDGTIGRATTVADVRANRDSGYPKIVALGDRALVAWTAHDEVGCVAAAVLDRR